MHVTTSPVAYPVTLGDTVTRELFTQFHDLNDWSDLTGDDGESIIQLAHGRVGSDFTAQFTQPQQPLTGEALALVPLPGTSLCQPIYLAHELPLPEPTITGPELARTITTSAYDTYQRLHTTAKTMPHDPSRNTPSLINLETVLNATRLVMLPDIITDTALTSLFPQLVAALTPTDTALALIIPDTGCGDIALLGVRTITGDLLVTCREPWKLTPRCDIDASVQEYARDMAYTITTLLHELREAEQATMPR